MPHLPTLPLSDPVLIFALAMVVFLVIPLLFERLRVPGLIGLIISGAVIGENGVGLLERDHTIVLFGTVGLVYLMFLVGLELDLAGVRRNKSHTIVFGLMSFALPLGMGIALGLALGYPLRSAALIGAMLSSHTSVGYPIASRLGIVKTKAVTTALGATLIVDLLALLVLAIVSKASGGGVDISFWVGILAPLALYVALVLIAVPRAAKWFFRNASAEGPAEYLFTLAVLFSFSYLAHLAGIEPVIGALLVGFALNRLIPEHSPLMNRIKFVAEAIFVPFFLLSVGMLIDVRAFADPSAWLGIAGFVSVGVLSKGIAAFVTTKVFRYGRDDGTVMFGLSVSRAAATIAIALVGYELEVIDEAAVNAVAMMILVTCIIGPWAVARFGRAVALREEQKPYAASDTPERILIPISNPKTRDALLDLAFILRGRSPEPIFPLMVVSGEDEDAAEANIAEAERSLSHAVMHAAGADVPVHPLTRVDANPANGIARGIAETRSTTIVVGWDGTPAAARYSIQSIFGSVLDQLLERTKQVVVVAKLGHPISTTERLVLVAPPAAHRHPNFYKAARTVKDLAQNLGAEILVLALEDDPETIRAALAGIKPNAPTTVTAAHWGNVLDELERVLSPNDLVVVLSTRRGMVSWHPRLERLPGQLARLQPESFLMLYPGVSAAPELLSESLVSEDEGWPLGLTPARIQAELPDEPWQAAVRRIIAPTFVGDDSALETAMKNIIDAHADFSAELRPGVVIPHARVASIEHPLVHLGVSRAGIAFPHTHNPAHLMFVLLSPTGDPQQHLRVLADLSRLVSSDVQLEELLQKCGTADVALIMSQLDRPDRR